MNDFIISVWDKMSDGKWHHIAFTKEDNVVKYYLDGQLRQEEKHDKSTTK